MHANKLSNNNDVLFNQTGVNLTAPVIKICSILKCEDLGFLSFEMSQTHCFKRFLAFARFRWNKKS